MKKAQILLIEDDDVDAMNIERAFKESWPAATLTRANDGYKALDLLNNMCPNIVILDLSMPGIHGLELLSEIKKNEKLLQVPVIVCSGSDAPEDIEKSYANRANAYTVKPSSISEYRQLAKNIRSFWGDSVSLTPAYLI